MRRWICAVVVSILAMGFSACEAEGKSKAVVGCWVNDDPSTYYFQLYKDGTCTMLDKDDRWVSSGTYEAHEGGIRFDMDTGSFEWARTKEGMEFNANGHTIVYHLQ